MMTGTLPPVAEAPTIDGQVPARTERPETAGQLAELLRDAGQRDEGVYPVGAGTHGRVGLTPDKVPLAVSTRGLAGVLRHDPDDLVVSVGAGTTLAELAAVLAERNQWLPVEAPGGPHATVGGLLALGLNGPRALGSPTLRDLLIGMRVAGTDGTVANSGGMVVKNVSGLDMGRLHDGARGTLGMITSANFKVWPVPETETTVLATFESSGAGLSEALQLAGAIRASALRPVATDIVAGGASIQLALRFEGRASGVRRQRDDARAMFPGQVDLIETDASAAWWTDHAARLGFEDDDVTAVRIDGRPRDAAVAGLGMFAAVAGSEFRSWRMTLSPGLGQAWLHLRGSTDDGVGAVLAAVPEGASVGLIAGAPSVRAAHAGPRTGPLRDVDRALRSQFDPAGVLNRGRWPLG